MESDEELTRPVWAEVDVAAIKHNVSAIKTLLKPTVKFCAVVKADGYGHGAIAVANASLAAGADYLAVAILNEALELRSAGITAPILVLGFTPTAQATLVVAHDITQTIYSMEAARTLSAAAVEAGKIAKVHVKIDTGMGRIGIRPSDAGVFIPAVAALAGIEIEGIFSHFATADSADKTYCREQMAHFSQAIAAVEAQGFHIPIRHIANSAATLEMPETHLDMVRPGIILYGLWPSPEVTQCIHLKPAMALKCQITQVREVAAGTSISYGRSYITSRAGTVAVLPIGYADGWTRLLSGKADILIRGQRAPLIGRICMDQCMADVTGIPDVRPGDTAVLFADTVLSADEVAVKLGTISYEVVCTVGKRVPRLYRNK
ncbi:alanine racemase [Pelosinus propionicus]|uniref:Alanine racemase n=1 Tax=Pelosinus propionicus DSM 13327 TaxID=1123291 RepID=A0A1I4LUE0_9FIRM|nr:alanine racemase [Pelosinus propionicus]SFL94453.1 alanine racemase [Pelosinus propionicus DSM 13327]